MGRDKEESFGGEPLNDSIKARGRRRWLVSKSIAKMMTGIKIDVRYQPYRAG
jgi:hypothetical protein